MALPLLASLATILLACRQPQAPSDPIPFENAFAQRAELIAAPEIINAHEHVGHDGESIGVLEAANAAVGIRKTVLLGSARHTLRLDKSGFIEHHLNNDYLCKLARENPDKYWAFVTFDPLESGIVERLAQYRTQGATGVKLYLGHGEECGPNTPFHSYSLDDPRILPLYEYCQAEQVPLLLHVNLRKFENEMRAVLTRYPKLPIILPHFGLKLGKLSEFDAFLEAHPSVYVDISFGWPSFQFEGLQRIHKNNEAVRRFFVKYQDRLLFGTDAVPTPGKDVDFVRETFLAYRRMLELSEYDFVVQWRNFNYNEHFKGLSLSEPMLKKIYSDNFEKLMSAGKSR